MSREAALAMATPQAPVEPVQGLSEAPQTETPKETPKELESTRFSHLAKKEAELQRQREEFKREREQTLAEKEKLKPIWEKITQFEELKKKDPVAAIKLLEFSESDLFNFIAAQEDTSPPEEKARKAAQDEIKKFQDQQAKERAEYEAKQNEQVINEFKDRVSKTITSNKDLYELSNLPGYDKESQEIAFEFTKECIQAGQEAPTPKECADYVEQYWEIYFNDMRSLMSQSKKLTPREAVEAAKEKIAQMKEEPLRAKVVDIPNKAPTLNNKMTASSAPVTGKETREQKRERLMNALRQIKT